MPFGKTFFLVNHKSRVDLLDKNLILLFGTMEYLKKSVLISFPKIISDSDEVLTVKDGDTIFRFYYGQEEVIEKFVLVDILFSDEPVKAISRLCVENKWHLYDFETERYVDTTVL